MRNKILVIFGMQKVDKIVVGDKLLRFFIFVRFMLLKPPNSFQSVLIDELVSQAIYFFDEWAAQRLSQVVLLFMDLLNVIGGI